MHYRISQSLRKYKISRPVDLAQEAARLGREIGMRLGDGDPRLRPVHGVERAVRSRVPQDVPLSRHGDGLLLLGRLLLRLFQFRKDRMLLGGKERGIRQTGAEVTPGRWLPYAFCLTGTSSLSDLPGYREGRWTIQDESSMFVTEAAGIRGDETVMDVCAAPGGKSMHAASLLREGKVMAFDLSRKKTDQIRKNIRRMGLQEKISVSEQDARIHNSSYENCADLLLCDLPCSGLGIIGRKRDIKYRIGREELTELSALQREILKNAVSYLKPGGILIYSTCTIDALENQDNADYIENELKLAPDSLVPFLPQGIPGIEGEGKNRLQLLPHIHGTDGFFVARFKKPLA